jgi:hypothetical protein
MFSLAFPNTSRRVQHPIPSAVAKMERTPPESILGDAAQILNVTVKLPTQTPRQPICPHPHGLKLQNSVAEYPCYKRHL